MGSEGRRKIAIVGGGPAGLAAAFELTKPGRIPGKDVTVYQMGWRLGGKCASGRDEQGRIVEHGLHLWFGYYENAFRLLQEVYAELPSDKLGRFPLWSDAMDPQNFTQIGDERRTSGPPVIPIRWPTKDGTPGDGNRTQLWDSLVAVVRLLSQFHDAFADKVDPSYETARVSVAPEHARAFQSRFLTDGALEELSPRAAVSRAHVWCASIQPGRSDRVHLAGVNALLKQAAIILRGRRELLHDLRPAKYEDRLLSETTDIAAAFVSGIIEDVIIGRVSTAELDEFDFRDWLISNGADIGSVNHSPMVRALYDMMFQYCDGQLGRPSYGAGTASQVLLRLLGTYKGHAIWNANAGLGEVLISPLYEVLKARGVRFEFFHKLERIELTKDCEAVARLHFRLQADHGGQDFKPTFISKQVTCWPDKPRGAAAAKGDFPPDVDFESRWCEVSVRPVTIARGTDFTEVILAIPLGAFKPFRDERGPCDELIRASARFRAMTENIGLVPSLSAQIWSAKTLSELGCEGDNPAVLSGPQPLQIWADMSQVVACESWRGEPPKSAYYFCNVLDSQAYRGPAKVGEAQKIARALAAEWFEREAGKFWPKATRVSQNERAGFDWNTLMAPDDLQGPKRMDAQVVKANVDPSACCVSSAAGSTGWRLKTDASGFGHLFLAGAWIDSGFNTECVEAAIMSGKQASRAICGWPAIVDGEDFLNPTGSDGIDPFSLARGALSVLGMLARP